MFFNSVEFILFFIGVFFTYWIIPNRFRWLLLLLSSYFFYISWEPAYIILILFSTAVDYFLCLHWTSSSDKKKKRRGLYLSIFVNLGLLFTFKYFEFFQAITQQVLGAFDVQYEPSSLGLLLPVGISFYTFQTLSYTIDVYKGKTEVERHFGKFALYVSFFPQLVAGPIERAKDLIPQFKRKALYFSTDQFRSGVLLILWAYFKR